MRPGRSRYLFLERMCVAARFRAAPPTAIPITKGTWSVMVAKEAYGQGGAQPCGRLESSGVSELLVNAI